MKLRILLALVVIIAVGIIYTLAGETIDQTVQDAADEVANVADNFTGDKPADAQQSATSTPVPTAAFDARPTYVVQRGDVTDEFVFTGRWQPRDQLALSFEIAGTIRQVNVQRGDAVSAGELLADYDITSLENQLDSAELSLETAINNQTSSTTGGIQSVEDAEISLANARISLENTRNSSPWTSVASARLSLDSAAESLRNAERSYYDALSHPEQGPQTADSAYQSLISAQNQVESAQISYFSAAQSFNNHQYSVQQSENQVIQAEIALERARNGQSSSGDESVRSAQLNIDQIHADIARSSLYAPIDGVVLDVFISPGDSAAAFNTVITIGLPEPKEVITTLAIGDAQQMSVGMVGACEVLNQPETAVGCAVRSIPLTSRDADQTTRVAASFTGVADNQLIEVTMPLETRENVLWLPPSVIRTFQNRTFVVLDTPDGPRTVDVQLGLQTDERVEIVSGVNEGDIVIAP
jgi:multidrug efflux pump subunit AcrA (membrane-fusion protein)